MNILSEINTARSERQAAESRRRQEEVARSNQNYIHMRTLIDAEFTPEDQRALAMTLDWEAILDKRHCVTFRYGGMHEVIAALSRVSDDAEDCWFIGNTIVHRERPIAIGALRSAIIDYFAGLV